MTIQLWKLWGHIISVATVDLLLTTHPIQEALLSSGERYAAIYPGREDTEKERLNVLSIFLTTFLHLFHRVTAYSVSRKAR